MTSGVLPFKRTTAFETAEAILNSIPDALPATVPVELRRIIERCLAKDPDARFATAAELRDALDAVHVSRGQTPRTAGVRAWRTAVAALLVAAVAGALYSAQRLLSPDEGMPTLAVLPLENTTGDAAQAFFADGFTEALD